MHILGGQILGKCRFSDSNPFISKNGHNNVCYIFCVGKNTGKFTFMNMKSMNKNNSIVFGSFIIIQETYIASLFILLSCYVQYSVTIKAVLEHLQKAPLYQL